MQTQFISALCAVETPGAGRNASLACSFQVIAGKPPLERVRRDLVLAARLAAAAAPPVSPLRAPLALEHHVAALLAQLEVTGMGVPPLNACCRAFDQWH